MRKLFLSVILVMGVLCGVSVWDMTRHNAYADPSGSTADLVANKTDLMQIYTSAGAGPQAINWETLVRSTVGAVNWTAIVNSSNSINWAQVILPTAP